jgi:isopenicillin-N epimerase
LRGRLLPRADPADVTAGLGERQSSMVSQPSNALWGDDWPEVRAAWRLDWSLAHLNHGSFGAVPGVVGEEQERLRREAEANPNRFFGRALEPLLVDATERAAAFLQCDPGGLALVTNATIAASIALQSASIGAGDEILITDHAYPATLAAAERVARRRGARLTVASIALPEPGTAVADAEADIVAAVLAAVRERTVIAVLDQITSPTALRLPVARLCRELRDRGVLSLVDGAHAPGMLTEGPTEVGADFWLGNFHKWPCAPRGATGLVVHPDQRAAIEPLAPSSSSSDAFPTNLAWYGTADYTPYLCVPPAIQFLTGLGWDRLRAHNRALVRYGASVVADALGTAIAVPDGLFEAMALMALPAGVATDRNGARSLVRCIAEQAGAEVAVTAWNGRGWLRLSAHAYNHPGEYEALAATLPELLR